MPGKGITKAKVKRWAAPADAQKLAAAVTAPSPAANVASLPYHGFSFSSTDSNLEALFNNPTDKAYSLIASPADRPEDRPFLLISACMPDETAAASIDGKTQGRSAFTYCLLDRIDRLADGLSAIDLVNAAGAELRDLQLRQTPVLKEPADPPHLGSRRFPNLEAMPARRSSDTVDKTSPSSPADVERVNQLLAKTITDILRSGMMQQQQPLTNKGFFDDIASAASSVVGGAVNTLENTAGSAMSGLFGSSGGPSGGLLGVTGDGFNPFGFGNVGGGLAQQVAPLVSMSLKTFATPTMSAAKGYQPADGQQQQSGQLSARGKMAAAITPVVVQALQNYHAPATQQNKAYSMPQPFDKGWFDSLTSIVEQIAPVVIDALKTYRPQVGQPASPAISQLQAAAQKGWFDDLTHVVATVLPTVIDAFKDFKPQTTPAQVQAQKGWFDDVMSVAQIAVPLVISAL